VVDVAGFAWEEFQVEKGVTFERSKRRETSDNSENARQMYFSELAS